MMTKFFRKAMGRYLDGRCSMVTVECRGLDPEVAGALEAALREMLAGLQAREGAGFTAAPVALVVVDELAQAAAEAGLPPAPAAPARALLHAGGAELLLDGRRVAAALGGEAQELARLTHLLHLELWRLQEDVARQARPGLARNAFEQHLLPVVEGWWAEYCANRRAVWSLPADADLLLPHLAELLEVLPAATAEDITLALADGDMSDLFARALGRVTHLLQVAGHVQGCLAGLGRSLESLSPELAERLAGSFLGPRWARGGRLLEALYGSAGQWDGEFLHNALRPEVLAVFSALALDLRPDAEGGLWLEPRLPGGPGAVH